MKKLKTLFQNDAVGLSLAGLSVFFAVYCTFPHLQLVATIPILLAVGFCFSCFYKRSALLIPIAALTAALLSLMLTEGYDARIFYAFAPSLFYLGTWLVSRVPKLFRKPGQEAVGKTVAVFCAILLVGIWFWAMGNPVSLSQNTKRATEIYSARYPNESFTLVSQHFDPLERTYKTTHKTAEGKSFTAANEEDGYLALMQSRAAELQKSALLKLLHEEFPSHGNFLIEITCPVLAPQEVSEHKWGDMPEEWLRENTLVLEFDSAMAVGSLQAKAEFAGRVRTYTKFLNEISFPYASITYRAGEYGVAAYELTATPESSPETDLVAPKVTELTR